MDSKGRIEKAKAILLEINSDTPADTRVIKLTRIVNQLLLICDNQQVEIDTLVRLIEAPNPARSVATDAK